MSQGSPRRKSGDGDPLARKQTRTKNPLQEDETEGQMEGIFNTQNTQSAQKDGDYVLPGFAAGNSETLRNKERSDVPMYAQSHEMTISQRDDDMNYMQRTNTQFGMKTQYYDPLPFDEQ